MNFTPYYSESKLEEEVDAARFKARWMNFIASNQVLKESSSCIITSTRTLSQVPSLMKVDDVRLLRYRRIRSLSMKSVPGCNFVYVS